MKHLPGLTLLVAITILGGCTSTPRTPDPESIAALEEAPWDLLQVSDPRGFPAFDGETGEPVAWAEVMSRAAEADVVLIGEMHGHVNGLAAAAALWHDLLLRRGDAGLSMEFFERDVQVALDDYLAGVIDYETFRTASQRSEGNYPGGHEFMVETARLANRPVIAANAPRRYVRLSRIEGYDRLREMTDEQRRLVEIPQSLPTGSGYYERFAGAMGHAAAHGDQPGMGVDDFFRSQYLWDATMADSIVRNLRTGVRPIVHVVGVFHVEHFGGTVIELRRRRSGIDLFVVAMRDSADPSLAEDDFGAADVIVHVGSDEAGDGASE